MALSMMHERAEAVGAHLSITSQPGHGTELVLRWTSREKGGPMTTSPSQPIRVMLVDDHTMVRRGLATFLKVFDDLQLAGEAESGEAAIQLCAEILPDVVLMDMAMPDMDGATATRAIRQQFPQVQVIALTSFKEGTWSRMRWRPGRSDICSRMSPQMNWCGPSALRMPARPHSPRGCPGPGRETSQPPPPGLDLTEREREVLALMVEGLNNVQIAGRLTVSPSTSNPTSVISCPN
jgi:two-component system, NarL family, response regulator LiaR